MAACVRYVYVSCVFLVHTDTFASKVAAIQDKYADASVGNVTGSNAVNVFLGIGVAWSIAAIYNPVVHGKPFLVSPGKYVLFKNLVTFGDFCLFGDFLQLGILCDAVLHIGGGDDRRADAATSENDRRRAWRSDKAQVPHLWLSVCTVGALSGSVHT